MEDRDLRRDVKKASRGDREAAASLFDTYHPRIYRYALARLGSPADAEDVASETFARVLSKLDGFRWKGGGFEAWLFRIASNLIVDRARDRAKERATDEAFEDVEATVGFLPEDSTMANETSRELRTLLVTLPDDQREILLLRFAGGLDTHEAGAVMGRNANAVRQLQFRALQNLRDMMSVEVTAR